MLRDIRWRKAIVVALSVVLSGGLVFSSTAVAEAPQPGTESDPLVSKSYVDQKVQAAQTYADAKVQAAQLQTGVANNEAAVQAAKSYTDAKVETLSTSVQDKLHLHVVNMTRGQALSAEEGTELIVRTGKATVVEGKLGGLSDLTAGVDRTQGEVAPANHLLLVPRTDGRGLVALTDVIVLVRGSFTLN